MALKTILWLNYYAVFVAFPLVSDALLSEFKHNLRSNKVAACICLMQPYLTERISVKNGILKGVTKADLNCKQHGWILPMSVLKRHERKYKASRRFSMHSETAKPDNTNDESLPLPPWIIPIREKPYEDHEPLSYDFQTYDEYFKQLNKQKRREMASYQPVVNQSVKAGSYGGPQSYGFKLKQIQPVKSHNGRAYTYYYMHSHHMDIPAVMLNGLRRVSLNYLPGGCVTALRIPGMLHEYYAIAGLREQYFALAHNLRHITFKNVPETTMQNAVIGKFRVKGPMAIVAGHMQLPEGIEIVNKNHYIGTLSAGSYLSMDVKIERINGTVMPEWGFESENRDIDENGFIHFASSSTPLEKFGMFAQRRGVSVDSLGEIVTVELHTDGSITPRTALLKCSDCILKQLMDIQYALHYNCHAGIDGTIEDEFEDEDYYLDPERYSDVPWNPYKSEAERKKEADAFLRRDDVVRQYRVDPDSAEAKKELAKEWAEKLKHEHALKVRTEEAKKGDGRGEMVFTGSGDAEGVLRLNSSEIGSVRSIEPSRWVLESPFADITPEDIKRQEVPRDKHNESGTA